jgi:hypothetical protein
MMILPIGEKYVTKTPYMEFLQKMRKDLLKEEIVIVIGYSFRDDPVNNAFIAISKTHRIKLIVVAPEAINIIRNRLKEKYKRFQYQLMRVLEMIRQLKVFVMLLLIDRMAIAINLCISKATTGGSYQFPLQGFIQLTNS